MHTYFRHHLCSNVVRSYSSLGRESDMALTCRGVEKVKEEIMIMRFNKPRMVSGKGVESSFLHGLCKEAVADASQPSQIPLFFDLALRNLDENHKFRSRYTLFPLKNTCF